ncbi:MAG: hypothetical protein GYA33_12125, partial [Thermogutta sp.]|nr:hypothetical protein [Thermogutta sp.]
ALTARDRVFAMGQADDLPFAVDLNGDGRSEVGVYRYEGAGSSDGPAPLQASLPKSAVGLPSGGDSDAAPRGGDSSANAGRGGTSE